MNVPFGEERREPRERLALFETRVHGAHEHAVLELREAQVERLQQMRVLGHGFSVCLSVRTFRQRSNCGMDRQNARFWGFTSHMMMIRCVARFRREKRED